MMYLAWFTRLTCSVQCTTNCADGTERVNTELSHGVTGRWRQNSDGRLVISLCPVHSLT